MRERLTVPRAGEELGMVSNEKFYGGFCVLTRNVWDKRESQKSNSGGQGQTIVGINPIACGKPELISC